MLVKSRSKLFILLFTFTIVFTSFFAPSAFASNKAKLTCLKHHSQGATITKDYFLYTDRCSDSKVKIYKCNRNGTQISNCKKIAQGAFQHANVLEHTWGSNYFWILDSGGKSTISKAGHHWCYSLSGEKVGDSKCGNIPNSTFPKNSLPKYHKGKGNKRSQNVPQGFTIVNGYRLKAIYNKNSVYIFKNSKKIKVIRVGHDPEELEDVMVDGGTGTIYFSTSGKGWVKLYKYSDDYKIPVTDSNSNNESDPGGSSGSNSSNNPSDESTSSNYGSDDENDPGVAYGPSAQHVTPSNDGSISTTFFGDFKDDGNGCGTYMVLNFIIDILAYGIGIAAIIGIAVSGLTYLSANGNQEKLTKSKRRIYEITIGVVAYALLYAGLNFLLPGGKFNADSPCSASTSTKSTTGTNSWQSSYSQNGESTSSQSSTSSNSNTSKTNNSPKSSKDYQKAINDMAINLAWKPGQKATKKPTAAFKSAWTKYVKEYDKGDKCHRNYGKSCGSFASTVLTAVGADAAMIKKKNYANSLQKYMSKSKKWQEIKKPEAGTVGLKYNGSGQWHVKIFVKYKGKIRAAEASHCDFWGKISSGPGKTTHIYRYVGD